MKYIIQIDLDPWAGAELESQPDKLMELMGMWQALNPLGFYISMTRRRGTIVVEAPNEESFFEALHSTWVLTKSYPEVWPVLSAEEMPAMRQRVGLGP